VPASQPGVIGGAVIKAARRSAGLSRGQLARAMMVSPATVRRWENGSYPLYCMSHDQLRRLAAAVDRRSAEAPCDLGELLLASQCDLLITGMLRGFEDYAEVPPVDEPGSEGECARDLLRWGLTGVAPARYSPHASAPLLVAQDVIAFTTIARDLSSGSHGDQLTGYGAALVSLVDDQDDQVVGPR
jgi:transcriptional regulator with XRE-family HTH domain